MTKYQLIQCMNKKRWNYFVDNSPQGNIFCKTEFLDIWNKEYDLYFVMANKNIILGIPITKEPTSTFLYQGMLYSELFSTLLEHKKTKKELELINFSLEELEKKYTSLSFPLHYSFKDIRAFQWFHYHTPEDGQFNMQLRYTGILDISKINTFDEILSNSRTVRRQEYRKAIKEGFHVEETEDIKTLDQLHDMTFKRQGITRNIREKKLTTELAADSLKKGYGRLLICKDKNNTPMSASLFLFDNKCAYYLIGANNPAYRKFGVGTFVLYQQIKKSMELGLRRIDFVGINSPNRGDYKISFNAKSTPYYTLNWKAKNNEIS